MSKTTTYECDICGMTARDLEEFYSLPHNGLSRSLSHICTKCVERIRSRSFPLKGRKNNDEEKTELAISPTQQYRDTQEATEPE